MTVIVWPQWIGATDIGRAIEQGAQHLVTAFRDGRPSVNVDIDIAVNEMIDYSAEQGIVGRRAILDGLATVRRLLPLVKPPVLLLGGDCSTDVALIAHMNEQTQGELNVVYFDAHADINTPEVSASGAFHGMVLGHLLGSGDADVTSHIPLALRTDQLHYRGVRVFDESEVAVMKRLGLTVQNLDATPPQGPLHLHIDLDVLDPNSFPHTTWPAAGGPTVEQLAESIKSLIDTDRVISIAVTECAAPSSASVEVLRPLLDVLRDWVA